MHREALSWIDQILAASPSRIIDEAWTDGINAAHAVKINQADNVL